MKQAILCDRVSSDEQAELGRGIEYRLEAMRAYCLQQGLTPYGEPLIDDITGVTLINERPQGRALFELIAIRAVDVVLWHGVDRVGRDDDGLSLALLRRACRQNGIELHFVKGGREDLHTPMAGIVGHAQALGAAEERRRIVERTSGGRRIKIVEGGSPTWGIHVYGHRVVDDEIEIDPDAARHILRARDAVLGRGAYQGEPMSVRAVAAMFDAEGVPTPSATFAAAQEARAARRKTTAIGAARRKERPRRKVSKYWLRETLSRVLRNPAITGRLLYDGVEIIRPDLAIISEADQAALIERIFENRRSSPGSTKHEYLLAKHFKCACGMSMSGSSSMRAYASTPYSYYRCVSYTLPKPLRTCKEKPVNTHRADDEAWSWILSIVADPERLRAGIERMNERSRTTAAPIRDAVARLDARITQAEARLKRLAARLGDVEDDDVGIVKTEMAQTRQALRTHRAERDKLCQQLQRPTLDAGEIEHQLASIAGEIEHADMAAKQYVARRLGLAAELVHEGGARFIRYSINPAGILLATMRQPIHGSSQGNEPGNRHTGELMTHMVRIEHDNRESRHDFFERCQAVEQFILSGQAQGMSAEAIANRFSIWHQTVKRIQRKLAATGRRVAE